MKKAEKVLSIVICLFVLATTVSFVGCDGGNVLRIYNCQDYIDEDLLDEFEDYYYEQTGKKITVKYSCFDTPEDAYNDLKINPKSYDLICPSDYMIEKMAREDKLQKFTMDDEGYYMQNVSPYIKNVFESISWEEEGEKVSLADYAVGYMWGTLGLVYNPAKVTEADMTSWTSLWEAKYSNKFTIKNSVRDTFFIGLAKHFNTELNNAKTQYNTDKASNPTQALATYQGLLKGYFNNTVANTLSAVETELINLANNCRNLEVDDGKEDVIKGDVDIYFAWSGDAVYSLDEADKKGVTLKYSVPDEGSNIWFDGWVIPKASEKTEEAKMFLDFISNPENVVRNMDYIGYTSCVAGQEVFDYVVDCYDEDEGTETDLSYFFGEGDYVITCSENNRQFYTQYPPKEVIDRCVVMSYFPTSVNEAVNSMWIRVLSNIR